MKIVKCCHFVKKVNIIWTRIRQLGVCRFQLLLYPIKDCIMKLVCGPSKPKICHTYFSSSSWVARLSWTLGRGIHIYQIPLIQHLQTLVFVSMKSLILVFTAISARLGFINIVQASLIMHTIYYILHTTYYNILTKESPGFAAFVVFQTIVRCHHSLLIPTLKTEIASASFIANDDDTDLSPDPDFVKSWESYPFPHINSWKCPPINHTSIETRNISWQFERSSWFPCSCDNINPEPRYTHLGCESKIDCSLHTLCSPRIIASFAKIEIRMVVASSWPSRT